MNRTYRFLFLDTMVKLRYSSITDYIVGHKNSVQEIFAYVNVKKWLL